MTPLFALEWHWDAFGMALLAAAVFGLLGVALLTIGFKVFELITPRLDVEKQLQEGNIAVGIVVGALLIAIAIVVAVSIHG